MPYERLRREYNIKAMPFRRADVGHRIRAADPSHSDQQDAAPAGVGFDVMHTHLPSDMKNLGKSRESTPVEHQAMASSETVCHATCAALYTHPDHATSHSNVALNRGDRSEPER